MFKSADYHSQFLFVPLGGSGEIGMNVNLYHYKGEWLMVDLGMGFASENMPGIDVIVPDLEFIFEKRANLKGIILTHAHEDHYGALPLLWEELRCPVYATRFTAECLRSKLESYDLDEVVPISEVPENGKMSLGCFELEYVNLTHSIPEMNAVVVRTEAGTVLHTGDWKFDDLPVVGKGSNKDRLQKLGEEGVLAMVCDSTNIMKDGASGFEGSLVDSIEEIISSRTKLVAVTLFASNVARVETVSRAAIRAGRKIIVWGRALQRIVHVAQKCGYLHDIQYYDIKDVNRFSRDEILLLCTGCQGEPRAALSRLVAGDKNVDITLESGDAVIFSSKVIPGNERRIFSLFNGLALKDVEVITEQTHNVHVSGHPCKDELRTMYELVKPKCAIPVHGEHMHIMEHAKMAKYWGAQDSIRVRNGSVVHLNSEGGVKIISQVHSGFFGVDGMGAVAMLHHPDGDVMRMRRVMSSSGIIFIIAVVDSSNQLLRFPTVYAPGVFDRKIDAELINKISLGIESIFFNKKTNKIGVTNRLIKSYVRSVCRSEFNKECYIHVQIEIVV